MTYGILGASCEGPSELPKKEREEVYKTPFITPLQPSFLPHPTISKQTHTKPDK